MSAPLFVTSATGTTPAQPLAVSRAGDAARRSEPRFPCDAIPARIRTESGAISARIMDISRSGIRLELPVCLPVPCDVTVCFNNVVVAGEIRYCRPNPDNSFAAGLQIQDVINTV